MFGLLFLLVLPAWAQAFQVGVLPNLSPRVLLTNYRPLRDYLAAAEQLNRFADAAIQRVEAIKCGPLFDTEKAA